MNKPVLYTILATLALSGSALAGDKVEVCHETASGKVLTLNVSVSAEDAHLDHGDWSPVVWFADMDGDGFGDSATTTTACDGQPAGFVATGTDLDDSDADVGDTIYEEVGAESADVEGEEDVEEY